MSLRGTTPRFSQNSTVTHFLVHVLKSRFHVAFQIPVVVSVSLCDIILVWTLVLSHV